MKNIVILISGRGSNMQAIVNAGIPDVRIAAVFSNSATAAGLAWAAERGIPTDSLNHKDFASRGAFDRAMMEKIDPYPRILHPLRRPSDEHPPVHPAVVHRPAHP